MSFCDIIVFMYKNVEIPEELEDKKSFWELARFAIIAIIIVVPIRIFIAQPFIVSGSSMYPTFVNGEYLIVDELSYHLGEPKRDDVVIFKYPLQEEKFFIKRIIGLPGETVEIKKNVVTIYNSENPNGMVLAEPYIKVEFETEEKRTLLPNEYYVMGDNRNASSDSRYWGPVRRDLLVGKAFLRLLPPTRMGIWPGKFDRLNYTSGEEF